MFKRSHCILGEPRISFQYALHSWLDIRNIKLYLMFNPIHDNHNGTRRSFLHALYFRERSIYIIFISILDNHNGTNNYQCGVAITISGTSSILIIFYHILQGFPSHPRTEILLSELNLALTYMFHSATTLDLVILCVSALCYDKDFCLKDNSTIEKFVWKSLILEINP